MVDVPERPTDPWKEPQSIWLGPSHAALKKLLAGSWWNHLWLLNRILYWALSATSQLLSHKLSVWPACCTVLPVICLIWLQLISVKCALPLMLKILFGIHQTCSVAMLQLVGWTWPPIFRLFTQNIICHILIGWNCLGAWLAKTAWVIGSPEPSAASMLSASNENTERQDPAAWTARNTVHNKAGKWLHTQTPGAPPFLPGRSNRGMQKYFTQKNDHKKADAVSIS